MKGGKAICLLVFLAVVFAAAEVDVNSLFHKTSSLVSEIDSIVSQSQFNPLNSVRNGEQVAPHASSAQELAQEVPMHSTRARKPVFPSLNAFAETKSQYYYKPDLSSPAPPEPLFTAARYKFNGTAVSDIELRLRKVWPKPVFVQDEKPVPADPLINAAEVLPKDPTADSMLHHFNSKYGVSNDPIQNLPPVSALSDDFLKKIDHERGLSDIERDYKTVYSSANRLNYDPEVDTIASLDKHLATLWAKRYEYLTGERDKAFQRHEEGHYDPTEFAIDARFVAEQPSPSAESTLGVVHTFNVHEKPPLPFIKDRANFHPEFSYYGPSVVSSAVNIASLKSDGPNYATPQYTASGKPEKTKISLVPKAPTMDMIGDQEPTYKEPVDPNRLVPAASINSVPFSTKPHTDIIVSNDGYVDVDAVKF